MTSASNDVIHSGDVLDSPEAGGVAVRGSAVRAAGFAATFVLGLISAPLLTRHLGPEFGRYTQVVSLVAVVGAVTEAGLTAVAIRELSSLRATDRKRLMRELLGLRIVLTLAGIVAAVAFAVLADYGRELVWGTLVAGVGLMTYVLHGAFALPLAVDLRLGWLTVTEVLRQFVFVVVIAVLVLLGAGIGPLLAAPIAAGIAAAALAAWLVRGTAPWRPSFDFAAAWRILRDTLPLAVAGALYAVYFRVVILGMSVVATKEEINTFALSFRIIEVVVAIPYVLVGSLLPILSRAANTDEERFAFGFGRTVDVVLIMGVWVSLVTAVGAPLGIAYLTGYPSPEDVDAPAAVEALRLHALTLLGVFLNVAYGTAVITLRRNRALIVANAVALLAIALGTFALVPRFGAQGGALATVVGEWVLVGCYMVAVVRARRALRPRLRPLIKPALAAAVAAPLALTIELPLLPNAGAVAIVSIVYLAVLAALRGIPSELVTALLPSQWRRAQQSQG